MKSQVLVATLPFMAPAFGGAVASPVTNYRKLVPETENFRLYEPEPGVCVRISVEKRPKIKSRVREYRPALPQLPEGAIKAWIEERKNRDKIPADGSLIDEFLKDREG